MEITPIGWTAIASLSVLILIIAFLKPPRHRHSGSLRAAANTFKAKSKKPLQGEAARIELEVQGCRAILTGGDAEQFSPFTRMAFQYPGGGSLRVRRKDLFTGLRKYLGAVELKVGDAEFDAKFRIEASPPEFAKTVLGYEAREGLMKLHALAPMLDVHTTTVSVWVRKNLDRDYEMAVEFFKDAVRLFVAVRAAHEPPSEERVPVGTKSTERFALFDSAETTPGCQICGTPLDDKPISCAKCSARHHSDCWVYLGGCGTFACGSTQIK